MVCTAQVQQLVLLSKQLLACDQPDGLILSWVQVMSAGMQASRRQASRRQEARRHSGLEQVVLCPVVELSPAPLIG
jgi:hypothetical protein